MDKYYDKERRVTYTSDGMMFYDDLRYVDWKGNPVSRTPEDYSYSYDAYVISKKAEEYQHVVYSDRLLQWDYDKHNELCKKHFGNEGQYWSGRGFDKIEAFLQDYYDLPKLELVGIMEGCNVSSGFPYWVFMFNAVFYV